MQKMFLLVVLGVLLACGAQAGLINFDAMAPGTTVSGPGVFPDVIFSRPGDTIVVAADCPGPDFSYPNSARGVTFQGQPFRADFLCSPVANVSVTMGDYDADADTLWLKAFNSSNQLLAETSYYLDASVYGGPTLGVAAANIAYVQFGSDGAFPSSIFFDNFGWTCGQPVIPDASALLLALTGLGAVTGLNWRRKR